MKTCRQCKKELNTESFYRNRAEKGGRYPVCKPCWNEYIKKRETTGLALVTENKGV